MNAFLNLISVIIGKLQIQKNAKTVIKRTMRGNGMWPTNWFVDILDIYELEDVWLFIRMAFSYLTGLVGVSII